MGQRKHRRKTTSAQPEFLNYDPFLERNIPVLEGNDKMETIRCRQRTKIKSAQIDC
jgi:hypothetical protein